MADFRNDDLRIIDLIKALKAEMALKIWVDIDDIIFDGYVYQLYDKTELHRLHIRTLYIAYNKIKVAIDTEHRTYEEYQEYCEIKIE